MSALTKEEAAARLAELPVEIQGRIRWRLLARPNQLPPEGDWYLWLLVAGRGFGKTRTAAEWLAEQMVTRPMTRWAVVSPTFGDGRDVCMEGESGLLSVLDQSVRSYNRTSTEVVLKNGSRARVYPAITPDRLRGPQFHGAWLDEPASFRYGMTVWETLQPALRLGNTPKIVVTGTPAPVPLMRLFMGMVDGDTVHLTRGRTYDNADNLPPLLLDQLRRRYEGTRIGRQELEGELLEDVEGALWTYEMATRMRGDVPEEMDRIVVSIDPASTAKESSNETGIIVAGRADNRAYILEDCTLKASPLDWAAKAVAAYHRWEADAIVVETNQGGDMIASTIRTVDSKIRIKEVHATRGKAIRAEPIVSLYEQSRVTHCGIFRELEDQMCSWVPTMESPDRLDALVWALTDLMIDGNRKTAVVIPTSLEQTSPWKL